MSAQRAGSRSLHIRERVTLGGHRARCGDSHGHSGQRRLSREPSHPREGDPGRSQSPLWRLPRALRPGEAEPVKCVREARGGRGRGTGRAVRTSGAPGLWELGKTQPPLCSPRGCQGSGESQLSSLISTVEGRKHRRAISPGSPATEEA